MTYSIKISELDWHRVHRQLFTDDGNENAGVLLCGSSTFTGARTLLVRHFVPVRADQYLERHPYHIEVAPGFYNETISRALQEKLSPIIIHSHPGHTDAWYSASDDRGESRLLAVLESLLPGLTPASLVVTPQSVTGRHLQKERFVRLKGLDVRGRRASHFDFFKPSSASSDNESGSPKFDRQVRAFGVEGQRILGALKVGIVGVGGIGSLVAEELVRAGVYDFVLVDNDTIEISNVSRQFGSLAKDVGQSKVDITARFLKTLGAKNVRTIRDSAIRQPVLMELRDRDIIFSCVDNDRTRAILNRFAHQYLVPVIDHGTRLDGRKGHITAASGRVTLVGSGMVCLRCSHHLNSERIRAESMPPDERATLEREGYIMGIDEPAPAIVSLNTVVAGLGVTAAFNMFLNLTGGPQPVDQIYDARAGEIFAVSAVHAANCDVCSEKNGVKGMGDMNIVSAYE